MVENVRYYSLFLLLFIAIGAQSSSIETHKVGPYTIWMMNVDYSPNEFSRVRNQIGWDLNKKRKYAKWNITDIVMARNGNQFAAYKFSGLGFYPLKDLPEVNITIEELYDAAKNNFRGRGVSGGSIGNAGGPAPPIAGAGYGVAPVGTGTTSVEDL